MREKILKLDQEQVRYLYLSSIGHSYQEISDNFNYKLVTIQKKFSFIYEDLGFEKFGDRHERKRVLSQPGGVYDTLQRIIEDLKEEYDTLEDIFFHWPPVIEDDEERPVNLELMAMAIEDDVWEESRALMILPPVKLEPIEEEEVLPPWWFIYARIAVIVIVLTILGGLLYGSYRLGNRFASNTEVVTINPPGVTEVFAVTAVTQVSGQSNTRIESTPRLSPTPSLTPTITNTPLPTDTPTLTPEPLGLPFVDTFDRGYRDEWIIYGDEPYVVNGALATTGETTIYIGNETWKDYTIEIVKGWRGDKIDLYMRVSGLNTKLALIEDHGLDLYKMINGQGTNLTPGGVTGILLGEENGLDFWEVVKAVLDEDTIQLIANWTVFDNHFTNTHYTTLSPSDYEIFNSGGIGIKFDKNSTLKSVRIYPNP